MLKRRFDGKMIGTLFVMLATVCLSAFAAQRSADAWTLNPSDFRYDMTLYFSTSSKDYENLETYEIGAFINDECRGIAETIELPDGASCLYMRIRSNSSEADEVVFKLRDKTTGDIMILKGPDGAPFLFKPDQLVGLPSEPYILIPYYSVTIKAEEHGKVDFTDGMYVEGSVIEVEAVPEEGYHFERWSDGNTEAKRTITVNSDIELTATFAVSSYQVVFSIDGVEVGTLTLPYGSEIKAPEAPEKEGYTFAWVDVPATMPDRDLEINGTYTVNHYKITFVIDDVVIEETELAYGAEIKTPDTPDKEGHSFEGWLNLPDNMTMPAEDLTVFGTYRVNTHILTFKIDGETIQESLIAYGTEITAPQAPEKEGYTFTGWGEVPQTMPDRDLEINGTYTVNYYKLTFVISDEVIYEAAVAYGSKVEVPAAPEKEGYSFVWVGLPVTMPAKDLEVTGVYSINSYMLTFKVDDEVIEQKEVEFGTEIAAPEVPKKEGYKFDGWDEEIPATMPAHDLEITGKMVKDETSSLYNLLFDKDETVTVYNLNGVLLYKDVKAEEIKGQLAPGLYIINGQKVMVK